MTAASPGRHGVTDFTIREDGHRLRFANASYRSLPSIWENMSRAGARVGVYAFPATYPPEQLNGIQVCGFDTPLGAGAAKHCTFPPDLASRLVDRHGGLGILGPQQVHIGEGWHQKALQTMLAEVELRTRIVEDLLSADRYDCFAVHYAESDTVAHQFWQFCDPRSPRYRGSRGLGEAIGEVYKALDAALGRLIAAAGPEATVMLVSDHGSGGNSDRSLFLNRLLADQGFLQFRQGRRGRLANSAARGLRRGALALLPARLQPALFARMASTAAQVEGLSRLGGISWEHTRAYSEEINYYPSVWLNIEGREPRGTVKLQDQNGLLDEVTSALLEFRDPANGLAVVAEVQRREQLFDGPYAYRAPDLILTLADLDGYAYVLGSSRAGLEARPLRQLKTGETSGARGSSMAGGHRQLGLCVLNGPGIASGEAPSSSLADAGASVLALLGLGASDGADGRPWPDLKPLAQPAPAGLSPVLEPGQAATRPQVYSRTEEEQVAERLRALGYLS